MMIRSNELQSLAMTADRYPKTLTVLEQAVQDGVSPGFVVGYWDRSHPSTIFQLAVGNKRTHPSQPVTVDTIYDLASVSKVMATAALAGVLIDRGWLNWDTSVASVFSEYPFPEIQIRHLMSHTAGFTAWEPYWEKLQARFFPDPLNSVSVKKRQAAMRELILSVRPECQAGDRALYSDVSFLLLGFILEEIVQMPLDLAVRKFVWDPMGIQGAYYHRVKDLSQNDVFEGVAPTEDSVWRGGVLQGQVHDDNCWAMGGYGGHAGVFATARDVLHFARALYSGFFNPKTLHAQWTKVPGFSRTLGWDTPSGELPSAGNLFSPEAVGHLGFTGTSLWIDPPAGLAVVLLSNRVHPTRENIKIRKLRPVLHNVLRNEIDKNRLSG